MSPIGPAPVISKSSPTIPKQFIEWTAFPKGSKNEAISELVLSGIGQIFDSGITRYSAKAPFLWTPIPLEESQTCCFPALQFLQ